MNQVSLIFRFRTLFGSYPMSAIFILSYWKLPFRAAFGSCRYIRYQRLENWGARRAAASSLTSPGSKTTLALDWLFSRLGFVSPPSPTRPSSCWDSPFGLKAAKKPLLRAAFESCRYIRYQRLENWGARRAAASSLTSPGSKTPLALDWLFSRLGFVPPPSPTRPSSCWDSSFGLKAAKKPLFRAAFGLCRYIRYQRLLNWGARRAALRPYFLRSFILGSRVRKPAALREAR